MVKKRLRHVVGMKWKRQTIYLLVYANNAAMRTAYRCLVKSLFSISLGIYSGIKLLSQLVILCLGF